VSYPERLTRFLSLIAAAGTRADRINVLVDIARRYRGVPEHVAKPPYGPEYLVPGCESRVYAFTEPRPDGTLDYHYAVENPHGISAKALAAILHEALSGVPLEEITAVSTDVVYDNFGSDISMGKSMGLQGMVGVAVAAARRALVQGVRGR
jgi:cysteine desulfuration protein SufE